MKSVTGLVFSTARGSFVDGPGIRTVVFLKGCPLRCHWCHNPEGQEPLPETAFYPSRCVGCGACAQYCPNGAIDLARTGWSRIDRQRCARCGQCARVCDSLALRLVGQPLSVDELVETILRDRVYFETSGGGVTFSGGEPLLHLGFLEQVARRLKEHGIHIAVETCGHFDYPELRRRLRRYVDLVLFDIKLRDAEQHRRYTGLPNHRIIANLERLATEDDGPALLPRVPLVPGVTATEGNLVAIAELLRSLGLRSYRLLGYNPSGIEKWQALGKEPPGPMPERPMRLAEEQHCKEIFEHALQGYGSLECVRRRAVQTASAAQ